MERLHSPLLFLSSAAAACIGAQILRRDAWEQVTHSTAAVTAGRMSMAAKSKPLKVRTGWKPRRIAALGPIGPDSSHRTIRQGLGNDPEDRWVGAEKAGETLRRMENPSVADGFKRLSYVWS